MKTKSSFLTCWLASLTLLTLVAFLLGSQSRTQAAPTTNTYSANDTWTVPANVLSVIVRCWGGGGGSGAATNNGAGSRVHGGGAAGGSFAGKTITGLTEATIYTITVGAGGAGGLAGAAGTGAAGEPSWFGTASTTNVLAVGGRPGTNAVPGTPGGGAPANPGAGNIGDVIFGGGAGGNGASATSSGGGGGGSGGSAGAGGNGAAGATGTGGTNGPPDGAVGRAGTFTAPGVAAAPGGGAGGTKALSGATITNGAAGSVGGAGQVVLIFTPTATLTYDANGGTGSQTDPNSPYEVNATVTVLNQGTMTRSGYAFTGWNTQADGLGTPYNVSDTFTITSNTTLYAQWTVAVGAITASTNALPAMSTIYGSASASNTFTVSGTGLSEGILVTPPAGFEVSQTNNSGYDSTTTVAGSGTIPATTIYVRLATNTPVGTYSGNVACTSAGAGSAFVTIPASTVSQYPLTLTGAATQSKLADGTTTATLTSGTLSSTVNGDVITTDANFPQTNGGLNLTVTVTLTGDRATNYSLTLVSPSSLTASIYNSPTWLNPVSGLWDTATNWVFNTIADGSSATADFSQVNLANDVTVSLATVRTNGNILFGDTATNSAGGWTLDNGGDPVNTLVFDGTASTVTVTNLAPGKSATISAIITGTGSLTKNGNGTLILTGTNNYTGGTTNRGGTLIFQADQSAATGGLALGPSSEICTFSLPAGLSYAIDASHQFGIGGGGGSAGDTVANIAGSITNNGALVVRQPAVLNLNSGASWLQTGDMSMDVSANLVGGAVTTMNVNSNSVFTYTGTNTIKVNPSSNAARTGRTFLNIGGLFVTGMGFEQTQPATNSSGYARVALQTGGTLKLTADVPNLITTLVGQLQLSLDGNATIDTDTHSTTVTNAVIGTGSLIKRGTGTLTLTATNTYTGNTTVAGGILALQIPSLVTNSIITVTNGGVLQLDFALAETNQVTSLVLNGVSQPGGVYSSNTSPAYLAGAGSLLVVPLISTNAYLTSITLTPAGTLSPAFTTNGFSYTATNAYGVSPTVTVVNANLTATNQLIYNNTTNLLASGVASGPLTLVLGVTNVVTVRVTAQDGVTVKTYTVGVTMLPSQTVPVITKSVSGSTLTLTWPGDHLGWYAQSNSVSLVDSNSWFNVPNSQTATNLGITINPAQPKVFYRLHN